MGSDGESEGRLPSEPGVADGCPEDGDLPPEPQAVHPKGHYPDVVVQRCGTLPSETSLSEYLSFLPDPRARSAEARYANDYAESCLKAFSADDRYDLQLTQISDEADVYVAPEDAVRAAAEQQQFFKDVDAYVLEGTAGEDAGDAGEAV